MTWLNEVIHFFKGIQKSTWQEIVLSSFLIPFGFIVITRFYKWFIENLSVNALLKGFRDNKKEVLIYLSQLTVAQKKVNGDHIVFEKVKTPDFISIVPDRTSSDKNGIKIEPFANIDPLWSESDGRVAADIYNLLGNSGKTNLVKIADTVGDWTRRNEPLFCIGFNPKTKDVINECTPINFKIDGYALQLNRKITSKEAFKPNDAGIIQKTFLNTSKEPVFILAGLGMMGTETAGYILRTRAKELGRLYGNNAFCLLFECDVTKGSTYYEIIGATPKPSLWNMIQSPIVYHKWKSEINFI